jgi:acetyl esterase
MHYSLAIRSKWSKIAVLGLSLCVGCTRPSRQPTTVAIAASQAPVPRTYRSVEGVSLQAFVFAPPQHSRAGRVPAILLFHGGGWVAGSPDWVFASARRFTTLGFVAIPIQYRLSTDRVSPIEAFADVCAAFQWARQMADTLGVDPKRVAAYGVSAGGHLAALAATVGCGVAEGEFGVGGPDALVLWSPAVDVSTDGHFTRLLRDRATVVEYSPVEHVRARMPPVSIVQGDRDNLTPLSGARRFCESVVATGSRCDLNVYQSVGHLLTRNLANQEDNFDPDPVARDDGIAKQLAFLRQLWRR